MIPLRGRLIASLIPQTHTRPSGLVVVNRKDIADKARVVAIGAESLTVKHKPLKAPCAVGDIIYFKKYTAMTQSKDTASLKKGLVTLFWDDIIAVIDEKIDSQNLQ